MASRTAYGTWTPQKPTLFSGHYLRNRSTLDIGVLDYIGIVQHKELSPEVLSIPPGTPCIYCVYRKYIHYSPICPVEIQTFPVGWNCQSHNPRNLTALNEYYLFDIGVIFQEHNRGLN